MMFERRGARHDAHEVGLAGRLHTVLARHDRLRCQRLVHVLSQSDPTRKAGVLRPRAHRVEPCTSVARQVHAVVSLRIRARQLGTLATHPMMERKSGRNLTRRRFAARKNAPKTHAEAGRTHHRRRRVLSAPATAQNSAHIILTGRSLCLPPHNANSPVC